MILDSPSGFPAYSLRFESQSAFAAHVEAASGERARRRQLADAVSMELSRGPLWFRCTVGDHTVPFQPNGNGAASDIDWREGAMCPECQLNARMRFCLELMRTQLFGLKQPRVYLTEQATFGYVAARRLFPGATGSEYVFDDARRELLQGYIRSITGDDTQYLNSEDVTALSFSSGSLDAVGSFEVLEHVPAYHEALAEFARVLKPGGLLLMTAPFLEHSRSTLQRARIGEGGSVVHIEPPEYHGDPASPDGALCFYHFGWDLLDAIRAAGFTEVEYVTGWSLSLGLLGDIGAFVARRSA